MNKQCRCHDATCSLCVRAQVRAEKEFKALRNATQKRIASEMKEATK